MNRNEELRALAERVTGLLPPAVTDVVLTGSTSRGTADELSDVELLVIADEVPGSLPLRDVQSWTPPTDGAHWFGGLLDGDFVELVWWTPAHADERVRSIAAGEIADWQRLKTAEAIVNGIVLRGSRHAEWTARLARYPDGLTEKIVADASTDWLDLARAYRSVLRPGDSLVRAWRVAEDAENILRVVFALNEEWPPGWKRLRERVEPLPVKPDRLAERIDAAVLDLDVAALRVVAAETLALAPQLDVVARARERLAEPL